MKKWRIQTIGFPTFIQFFTIVIKKWGAGPPAIPLDEPLIYMTIKQV